MALNAVVEVALHCESFRNIDLFHQGLYHLKMRLCRDGGDGQHVDASPCGHLACPSLSPEPSKASKQPARPDHHNLIPAHIIEEQLTFSSRSFLIRYCEEEVEINDIGQFRFELDSNELSDQGSTLLLTVDLMFADLTQHGGADRFGEQPDVDSTEFKSVSVQQFRLQGTHRGLHEFCPIVFDEYHFCLANVAVHTVLLDYRFRLRLPPAAPTRSWAIADGKAGRASGASPAAASPREDRGSGIASGGSRAPAMPATPSPALSLTECLFKDAPPCESREQLLQRAEGLYQKHLNALVAAYTRLAEWFKTVSSRCLEPGQREMLGSIDLPDLEVALLVAGSGGGLPAAPGHGMGGTNGRGSHLRQLLEQKFGADVSTKSIAAHLARDMNAVSCRILESWHTVLNVLMYTSREVTALLRKSWERSIAERWGQSIVKEAARTDWMLEQAETSEWHHQIWEALRRAGDRDAGTFAVEDLSLVPPLDDRPLVIEQRYVARPKLGAVASASALVEEAENLSIVPSAPKHYRGVHLFVLVHGLGATCFDLRLMKNNLALLFPDAIFLCSASNEEHTEGDMQESGIRLAQEVVNYICDWCPGSALGRLSFVTHSAGGLIARAALPLLHEYSDKMYTIFTQDCPHLGVAYHEGHAHQTVQWVIRNVVRKESSFWKQIGMYDQPDKRETFIYKLSKAKGLDWFQNVVLTSCAEDNFVTYESSRVVIREGWEKSENFELYCEMVRNIWGSIRPEAVTRLDVDFVIHDKNFDTFTGRAAHIKWLESQPILKMLIHNYSSLFR